MSMKIVAGLGSADEYIRYCEAGADEFFCGYVPYEWTKKYGTMTALNRREVLCCNVQIGGQEELEILSSMINVYQKPVHLTFNSLYYLPEQYPLIAQIISDCIEMGFRSYIIADPALILHLREQGINCEIHMSGELGEINSGVVGVFYKMNLKRIIFHRKNSAADMRAVIEAVERNQHSKERQMEYEAFVLNELCQFSGSSAILCIAMNWGICAGCRIGWERLTAVGAVRSLSCQIGRRRTMIQKMTISVTSRAAVSASYILFRKPGSRM